MPNEHYSELELKLQLDAKDCEIKRLKAVIDVHEKCAKRFIDVVDSTQEQLAALNRDYQIERGKVSNLQNELLATSEQLAASRAYAQQLRNLMNLHLANSHHGNGYIEEALELPVDTSTLDSLIEKAVDVMRTPLRV